jgi:Ca-activated chloride channel family protein
MRHLSLSLSLFLFLPPSFLSAQPAPIVLILDGSGSMWGKIGTDTKIGIARTVVSDLLDDLAADQPVGLVAYGHRQKGDCEDIETLHAPATGNRAAIKSSLKELNPVGKTPLAAAALATIEDLKTRGGSATLILVSDGAESCGGDLCAVITAAREAGLDFVLHVVGFDLGESDRTALECAARAGGGNYYEARDGTGLSTALEQASTLTVEAEPATLAVKVLREGKPHDAIVKVFAAGAEDHLTAARTYTGPETNPALFSLVPGSYDIQVEPLRLDVAPARRNGIAVANTSLDTVYIDFAPGILSVKTTNNDELWDCAVKIIPTGEQRPVAAGRTYSAASSNPLTKQLDPGYYRVEIDATRLKGPGWQTLRDSVLVVPGQTTVLHHAFASGELRVGATHNGELWDCTVNIQHKGQNVDGGRTYTAASSNPKSFTLTPGTYSVTVRPLKLDTPPQTFEIEVPAGEPVERVVKF